MFSTRIYLKIVFQVALILLVTGVGLTGIITGKAIILGCVTLLIALWLVGILVYFLNTSNRRIQLFLDAIEDNESMLYFPENSGPEEQRRLHTAFNRIHRLMTESKQKEFERELLRKEYEAYDKLMHVLTHEIMNSIAPVTSLSDTLLSMHSDPEITPDDLKRNTENGLKVISETGKGLISFVESYRKFTRIPRPERELINLNEFIQRAVILSSTEPNFPEVTIDVCIEPEDLKVFADPNLMGQVLLNLMKNAFYALRGREDAHITLSAEHGPTGKVLIRVRDNGPGISPEIMNEIFVPFFTTKEEGSGIGLSVSRQIMRMHGGNLKVSSIEGKETVFTIII